MFNRISDEASKRLAGVDGGLSGLRPFGRPHVWDALSGPPTNGGVWRLGGGCGGASSGHSSVRHDRNAGRRCLIWGGTQYSVPGTKPFLS